MSAARVGVGRYCVHALFVFPYDGERVSPRLLVSGQDNAAHYDLTWREYLRVRDNRRAFNALVTALVDDDSDGAGRVVLAAA